MGREWKYTGRVMKHEDKVEVYWESNGRWKDRGRIMGE